MSMNDFTLILGPMKSGKSYDLISQLAPLQYTDIPFGVFHSTRNVRDETVMSRNGAKLVGEKISRLSTIDASKYKVIGIDEVHMFEPEDATAISQWLNDDICVVCSGLDMDYRGNLFDIIQRLLELGPHEVHYKRAVCEVCRQPNAVYTQVFHNGIPVTSGLPPVLPEDGTYTYQPVCRQCFKR